MLVQTLTIDGQCLATAIVSCRMWLMALENQLQTFALQPEWIDTFPSAKLEYFWSPCPYEHLHIGLRGPIQGRPSCFVLAVLLRWLCHSQWMGVWTRSTTQQKHSHCITPAINEVDSWAAIFKFNERINKGKYIHHMPNMRLVLNFHWVYIEGPRPRRNSCIQTMLSMQYFWTTGHYFGGWVSLSTLLSKNISIQKCLECVVNSPPRKKPYELGIKEPVLAIVKNWYSWWY